MTTATTFYKRPLPDGLISFSSDEGRAVFREALAHGTMEGFFALSEQFHTQSEPAFCGLGTLVVVLNALAIDPGRPWKGPWRWYTEEHLDCCRPLHDVAKHGMTLAQLACLARCNGARVETSYASASSEDALRGAVREACAVAGEPHLVVAYDRAVLGQTGSGHFSPLGGYHAERDLVLLMDVARFKYPPHWVPLSRLFAAMSTVDPTSSRTRGYALFHRGDKDAAFDESELANAVRCALDAARLDPSSAAVLLGALDRRTSLPDDVRRELEHLRSVLSAMP